MKECKKCKNEKELDQFCNKKTEKDGKHRYCKSCMKEEGDKYYQEVGKIERANYYLQYRTENKEYFNTYCKEHYKNNKEWYRNWERNRLKNDLNFRLKKTIGARINEALKSYNKGKSNRTIEYLGCSMKEYVLYLESLFTREMNWDNYGKDKLWEIDHIKPICKFNLNDEEEMKKCFHYTNTQPLTRVENLKKSGNY